MRILVTGKNGQLGRSIQKIINEQSNGPRSNNEQQVNDFIFVGRKELDLSSESNINYYFNNNDKFDIIINCAAYTAVDKAEEEQDLANRINHLAVKQLAQIAKNQQAKLIHISTDYVFDGESDIPYVETDETNPINVYGKTKLAGEKALQKVMPTNATIIRTSWVYSEYGNNFVKTMLKLGKERDELNVVGDQIGSPTYAADLANAILDIVKNKAFKKAKHETQVYHYSHEGEISWYDFAKEIFEVEKIGCEVNPIMMNQYKTLALRPKYSLLDNRKIEKDFPIKSKYWKESLNICLKHI